MGKTLLVGNFGAQNLGDEMILMAALKDYPKATVMTSNAEASQQFTESEFETVPFPPTGLRSFLKYLSDKNYRSEIVKGQDLDIERLVFPGGGLFAIKTRACLLWFLVFVWLKRSFPKAEFRFEHQGVDQDMNWLSKQLTQFVFARADFISVRDAGSGQALDRLGIRHYENSEDRVFKYLKSLDKQELSAPEPHQKLLLVSALRPFEVAVLEESYPDFRIVFVPFALTDISILPDDFSPEIIFPKTQTALFKLLAEATLLIGERFHSLVCGYHFCETQVLRKPYAEKVAHFCEEHQIRIVDSAHNSKD